MRLASAAGPVPGLAEPTCVPPPTSEGLAAFFELGAPIVGADYQRAYPLPSGRVLWLFQDALLPTPDGLQLVHNVGLLQSGWCVQLLRSGTADRPEPYLFADLTEPFRRWFWPLGGELGRDGHLHVFVAELHERGSRYLEHVEPVATWLATIDVDRLDVVATAAAPDSSSRLYGWSVVSSGQHTYLSAHCYRQFGWDVVPFSDPVVRAHDLACASQVTVARVARGELASRPEYWSGTGWTDDPATAAPVIPTEGRPINPTQVTVVDGRFIAATKVGDWWGDTIALDVAVAAEGPWQTYAEAPVTPACRECTTYFASFVPSGADNRSLVVGLSGNTWVGDDPARYHPTFFRIPTP